MLFLRKYVSFCYCGKEKIYVYQAYIKNWIFHNDLNYPSTYWFDRYTRISEIIERLSVFIVYVSAINLSCNEAYNLILSRSFSAYIVQNTSDTMASSRYNIRLEEYHAFLSRKISVYIQFTNKVIIRSWKFE